MKRILLAAAFLFALAASASADDKKPEGPLALKLVAKKNEYKFDGGGKTPAEYKKYLEELAQAAKKGGLVRAPFAVSKWLHRAISGSVQPQPKQRLVLGSIMQTAMHGVSLLIQDYDDHSFVFARPRLKSLATDRFRRS